MRIAIGSDHRGVEMKAELKRRLEAAGHTVFDAGPAGPMPAESCDYPDYAEATCRPLIEGHAEQGVLVCGSGIGMSIAANKLDGIRAALAFSTEVARLARTHNDANVLCLPGSFIGVDEAWERIQAWLNARPEGGRHERRIQKIHELERRHGRAAP